MPLTTQMATSLHQYPALLFARRLANSPERRAPCWAKRSRRATLGSTVKGPFSRLEGRWIFHPVGDGSQRACKVELQLDYGFDSAPLAAVVGPVFDRIANSMVDAFIKRAEAVYG